MVFEPLDDIYKTMPVPESGSSFPLAGLFDAEVVLWQDFEYEATTLNWLDLLRLLVGEKIGIRLPGSPNIPFRNEAPVFYTAMTKLHLNRGQRAQLEKKNQAMDERFKTRYWSVPLPMASRKPDFPKCARCFASFMLDNDAAWHRAHTVSPGGTWL